MGLAMRFIHSFLVFVFVSFLFIPVSFAAGGLCISNPPSTVVEVKKFDNLKYTVFGGTEQEQAKALSKIALFRVNSPMKPVLFEEASQFKWGRDSAYKYFFVDQKNCNLVVAVDRRLMAFFGRMWNEYVGARFQQGGTLSNTSAFANTSDFIFIKDFSLPFNVADVSASSEMKKQCVDFFAGVEPKSLIMPDLFDLRTVKILLLSKSKLYYSISILGSGRVISMEKRYFNNFNSCWAYYVEDLFSKQLINYDKVDVLKG